MFIQDYLRNKTGSVKRVLNEIQKDFGIKSNLHEDGRVILNYDQIESQEHKLNPMVMECRGLVLDTNDNWSLVARAFPRFFNLGEDLEGQKEFDWESCLGTSKEDGSLLIVYYWKGQWRFNTRNSYTEGVISGGELTWRELAEKAIENTRYINWTTTVNEKWEDDFVKSHTYVFELCSPYNKIVRTYPQACLYLLTIFIGENELGWETVEYAGKVLGISTPQQFVFDDHYEVENYINHQAQIDKTWEGVVLRDKNNLRIKAKSAAYVSLHKLKNNDNLFLPKNLIKFVLEGETDEVLTYFPEMAGIVDEMQITLTLHKNIMNDLWERVKGIEDQKEFAMEVKDTLYNSFMFAARKYGKTPVEIMYSDSDLTLKKFFGDK